MDIGPGDWVEAIRTYTDSKGRSLIKGMPYLISRIVIVGNRICYSCKREVLMGVQIAGINGTLANGRQGGWCPCNFRKIPPPEALVRTRHLCEPA